MQTFLPYPDFAASLAVLDYRRLGKQRLECLQLLRALRNTTDVNLEDQDMTTVRKGWVNHPAAKMWRGHEGMLAEYHDAAIREWVSRGYKNTMLLRALPGPHAKPSWLGDPEFHASHRSNLLRKNPMWYSAFGWEEPDNMEYVWPLPA